MEVLEKTLVRTYKEWLLEKAPITVGKEEYNDSERNITYNYIFDIILNDDEITQVDYDKLVLYRKELEELYTFEYSKINLTIINITLA